MMMEPGELQTRTEAPTLDVEQLPNATSSAMPPFGREVSTGSPTGLIRPVFCQMVDASKAITSIHVHRNRSRFGRVDGRGARAEESSGARASSLAGSCMLNINMAQTHGSYTNQKGTALHVPWRLASCQEPAGEPLLPALMHPPHPQTPCQSPLQY